MGGVVVNAKRLAGAASAGEVLLDASTARLLRDAIKMESPGQWLWAGRASVVPVGDSES